jgi:uncharacterized protein YciI
MDTKMQTVNWNTRVSPVSFILSTITAYIMFIIQLHYIVRLEELDRHMAEHVAYLKNYYKKNVFIASGRKVSRTGGIILALADSKQEVEAIIMEDPFIRHKVVAFTITEFLTSQFHPDLKNLLKKK